VAAPRLVTTHEVAAFLNDNAWRYLDVVRALRERLEAYALTEEGRVVVYSIYSRGLKQPGGSEFKAVWQIRWKVNEKRTHGRPGFAIQDVGDIIGITAVCNYPGQVRLVEAHLDDLRRAGSLELRDRETKGDDGYAARHLTASLCDRQYRGVRCELQIKTVLHDAWTRWAHDLTYKPRGALPREIHSQMNAISGSLTSAEGYTQLLKDAIEKNWRLERKTKEAARLAMIQLVSAQVRHSNPKTKRGREYVAIVTELEHRPARYKSGALDKAPVARMLARIDGVAKKGYDFESCWAMTMLAALRDSDDLDYQALDYVERWVLAAVDHADKTNALRLKAFAFFVFNNLPAAADAAELELEVTERAGVEADTILSKANAAAHLAEAGDPRMAGRARELIGDVVSFRGGEDKLMQDELDTVGLVQIVFGEADEIRRGRKLCKKALDLDLQNPAAQAFYELRKRLAKEKLDRLRESA
jgi:ppGpp synthetase/RelA/SpoT-type nucleotidyltranferase